MKKSKTESRLEHIERYAAENRTCAKLILLDPERYGGPESLMVQWAHLVLDGYQKSTKQWSLVA